MRRRTFLKTAPFGLAAVVAACTRPRVGLLAPEIPAPGPPPALPFLFATGIENSYPRLPGGQRVDELELCGHYTHWREDFELARALGVGALRYGPAWYRTNPEPGRYDWSCADDQMAWLRTSGIAVVADLCHFGAPDWMSGFQDPAFPVHHAEYAREFAARYPEVRYYTPVNEIFVAANFSAMMGWWNECTTGPVPFARALRNLCLAHEMAVDAILSVRPDAVIVQAESIERFEPADGSAGAIAQARFWNEARFAALDLTLGRMPSPAMRDLLIAGGMTTADFAFFRERRAPGRRWIGVDYYATSEQMVRADGSKAVARRRVGLAALAGEYHARYGVPLFLSETSRVDALAVDWLAEQWDETMRLRAAGVPVTGFTWFPLVDVQDWRHALRELRGDVDPIGLHDLSRAPRAVTRAYAELIATWGPKLAVRPGSPALRAG